MGEARNHVRVDLAAIAENVATVRRTVGSNVLMLVVIKKNAYGHGLVRVGKACVDAGADRLAVAEMEEIATLRDAGIECPLHLLGPPLAGEADACVRLDAVAAITDTGIARTLNECAARAGKKVRCHILVDTGMGRLGPLPEDAAGLAREAASLDHLEIEGAFTHFHSAHDTDSCAAQLGAFLECVERARSMGVELSVLHAAACGTVFRMKEAHLDMVRVGLCIPGVYNDGGMRGLVTFRPAMKITSEISFVKRVPEGRPISYGSTYVTSRESVVATIPFGYGNGYHFALSNRGWVAVEGKKAPVMGRVTMDYIMVDVTDIPGAAAGAEAVILGSPGPSADELADLASVVPHEILCALGQRAAQDIEYVS